MTTALPIRSRALWLAAICLLAAPAAAQGEATVGVAPDGVLGGDDLTCAAACTVVQDRASNLDARVPQFAGTTHGVLVGWRVRAHGPGARARVRRLGLDAGAGTARAGAGAWTPLADTTATQRFPASLRVESGDAIGIDLEGATLLGNASMFGDAERAFRFQPALGDGEARSTTPWAGYYAFDATIQPDKDKDGLGDDTQDPCVDCGTGGVSPGEPHPDTGQPDPADPYAGFRDRGPAVKLARTARLRRGAVTLTVENPHAVPVAGGLVLKRGRVTVGKAKLTLAAGKRRAVKVKVSRAAARKRRLVLTARATLAAAEGKPGVTSAKVTARRGGGRRAGGGKRGGGKPAGGVDGRYKGGTGAQADWVAVVEGGVVKTFSGSTTLYCTDSKTQKKVTFGMFGEDPAPRVGADGKVEWEATRDYGFIKLKYTGTVAGGKFSGNAVVEESRPVSGVDPNSGLPRIEFDYCFAGQDFSLERK